MIKRIIIISIAVVLIIVLSLTMYSKLITHLDFLDNKELAIEYVEKKFDFNYELIDSRMGENEYPAPRTDSFIFYDSDNMLYFFVYSYGKGPYDLYYRATEEKLVFWK